MKKGLLSVIVPIYNASASLSKCVESILNQTYKDLEIILVDDGSTDNSGELCDKLAEGDTKIQVYHTENRGSIAARSFGVDAAHGDIITFVDSDDWIEPDMYLQMMDMYNRYEPEIVSSGLIYDDINDIRGIECDLVTEKVYDRTQILQEIIPVMMYDVKRHRRVVTSSLCTKIMRKDLWKEVLQNADSKITFGEDASIVYLCLAKAEKVIFLNSAWYHYCVNSNSMVHSYDINSFEKIKYFVDYMEDAYTKLGIWPQMKIQLKEYSKYFLYPAIKSVFGIQLGEPVYLFPYELVKVNSQVAIYGAGKVGRAYIRNLAKTNYAKVVAWVDKAYDKVSDLGERVQSPRVLSKVFFHYIVIAIENENIAIEIEQDLISIGISKDRIIWKKPEIMVSEEDIG